MEVSTRPALARATTSSPWAVGVTSRSWRFWSTRSGEAVFGQAVRARSELGGGWLAWVLEVDDMAPLSAWSVAPSTARVCSLTVAVSSGIRSASRVCWLIRELPFFVRWTGEKGPPAALAPADVDILEIRRTEVLERVSEWISTDLGPVFDGVALTFDAPTATRVLSRSRSAAQRTAWSPSSLAAFPGLTRECPNRLLMCGHGSNDDDAPLQRMRLNEANRWVGRCSPMSGVGQPRRVVRAPTRTTGTV